MNFTPLGTRILVQRSKTEEVTQGGLIIPEVAKEKPSEGLVVSVGKGTTTSKGITIQPTVSVGDKILFGKWSGTEISINDITYLIMEESDILGIVTE